MKWLIARDLPLALAACASAPGNPASAVAPVPASARGERRGRAKRVGGGLATRVREKRRTRRPRKKWASAATTPPAACTRRTVKDSAPDRCARRRCDSRTRDHRRAAPRFRQPFAVHRARQDYAYATARRLCRDRHRVLVRQQIPRPPHFEPGDVRHDASRRAQNAAAAEHRPRHQPRQRPSVMVRVNDRGPFHYGRVIDLSYAAAVQLGITQPAPAVSKCVPCSRARRRA